MLRFIFSAFLAVAFTFLNPALLVAQKTILINPLENQSGDRSLDWLGEGLALALGEKLSARPELYVFSLDERHAEYDGIGIPESLSVTRATAMQVSWDMGADVLVTGGFSRNQDDFTIDTRILDLAGNNALFDLSVHGKLDEVIPMASALASQLSAFLDPGTTLPESDYARRPPVPRSAFEAYVRGVVATDPERKVSLLSDAIRLYPQYPAALYQLGQVYYLDSNYQDSVALLEKVPTDVPEYALARFMLGMNYYHLEDFAKAAEAFTSLPPDYDVLVNLGAALYNSGNASGAALAWRQALEKDPQGAEAAFNLGFLSFRRNELELAASRLAQFLESHARDPEALYLLGRTYQQTGRVDEAQRLIARAVRLSPRLERWADTEIPNILRVRAQFDATSLRMQGGITLWNPPRLARKAAANRALNALKEPQP